MGTSHAELLHGYTLADIDSITMVAVLRDFWHRGMDIDERRELAWSAIVECLYASDAPPTKRELIEAAWRAIQHQVHSDRSTHGISSQDVYAPMWNFWRFWWEQAGAVPSPEDRVVDRTALWQIWGELRPSYQRVLLALATHDDHERAAQALGIKRVSYNKALQEARRAFYERWHEGETPSRLWTADRRGGNNSQPLTKFIRRRNQRRQQTQVGDASA